MVLIHGLGLTRDSWGRVPDILAEETMVISYDLCGHGRSGRSLSGRYDISSHGRDLAAVLGDQLVEDQRAVLVGNSFGGGVMLSYAHEEGSARLSGAVFAGSGGSAVTLPGFPMKGGPAWLRHPLRRGWLEVLRGLAVASNSIRPVEPLSRWFVRRSAFEKDPPREAVDLVRQEFMRSRPDVLAKTARASGSNDPVRWADRLDVPALVLHGSQDPEVDASAARRLANALPRGELATFQGAGHMLALTRPQETAEHVLRLVTSGSAAGL